MNTQPTKDEQVVDFAVVARIALKRVTQLQKACPDMNTCDGLQDLREWLDAVIDLSRNTP